MSKPIALCVSDIHLTPKAPIMWDQKVWYDAQKYMLQQINQIAAQYHVPIICAGDIFDKPKTTPVYEHMAMQFMQNWNIIPGQHDLPHHNIDLMNEASYGVLNLHNQPHEPVEMDLYYFPWGEEFIPIDEQEQQPTKLLTCAAVHAMVWQNDPPYPGAPNSGNIKNLVKLLQGYDFIVAGDNHGGFVTTVGDTVVVNCGSTMRRTVAQMEYTPKMHLLFDDKKVESIEFDTSKDVVSAEHKEDRVEKEDRINAFVETLTEDVDISLSYRHNIERYIEANKVEENVKQILLEELC